MSTSGPLLLRQTTNHVLDALLRAAETAYHDQSVGMRSLHDIVEAIKNAANLDEFYRHAYLELTKAVDQDKLTQKRINAYGRLMIHPLNQLLQNGVLDRALLPQIFSFLHMVLGDDSEVYGETCKEIVTRMRAEMGDGFTWDAFYADPEAARIQWHTLTRIATLFKRWDLRKEWFLKLMQYTPATVSLGQSTFVLRSIDHSDEPRVFGNHEFCAFFQALFRPMTEMSPEDEIRFRQEFGTDPHHLIGQFLVHLASCEI
jgi:hypothetical protein